MKGKIYALKNPINNETFYIGATSKTLTKRLEQHYNHLNEAKEGKRIMNKRLVYLQNLLPLKATIICLEECDTNLYEKEIYYIEVFIKNGHPLVNGTKGGQGGNTYINLNSEELENIRQKVRDKLTGKAKPEGFSEHLSNIRKGIGNPAAGKTKYDKIVLFDENGKAIKKFNAGYEINEFFKTNDTYGNLIKKLVRKNGICTYLKYNFKFLGKCSEEEIKDIV